MEYMTQFQKCWGALDSGVFVLQLRKLYVDCQSKQWTRSDCWADWYQVMGVMELITAAEDGRSI